MGSTFLEEFKSSIEKLNQVDKIINKQASEKKTFYDLVTKGLNGINQRIGELNVSVSKLKS